MHLLFPNMPGGMSDSIHKVDQKSHFKTGSATIEELVRELADIFSLQ